MINWDERIGMMRSWLQNAIVVKLSGLQPNEPGREPSLGIGDEGELDVPDRHLMSNQSILSDDRGSLSQSSVEQSVKNQKTFEERQSISNHQKMVALGILKTIRNRLDGRDPDLPSDGLTVLSAEDQVI